MSNNKLNRNSHISFVAFSPQETTKSKHAWYTILNLPMILIFIKKENIVTYIAKDKQMEITAHVWKLFINCIIKAEAL